MQKHILFGGMTLQPEFGCKFTRIANVFEAENSVTNLCNQISLANYFCKCNSVSSLFHCQTIAKLALQNNCKPN